MMLGGLQVYTHLYESLKPKSPYKLWPPLLKCQRMIPARNVTNISFHDPVCLSLTYTSSLRRKNHKHTCTLNHRSKLTLAAGFPRWEMAEIWKNKGGLVGIGSGEQGCRLTAARVLLLLAFHVLCHIELRVVRVSTLFGFQISENTNGII